MRSPSRVNGKTFTRVKAREITKNSDRYLECENYGSAPQAQKPCAGSACRRQGTRSFSSGRTPAANCHRATYTLRHPTHSYTRGARHYGTRLEGTPTQ
ncbi:hypothetical protein EVAR_39610_1 [Eumeta japonica]|uniref:Uncharacterized protein n=1 Tax=Eumeta variegata TaxID=151549 RepID=A0A4C1WIS1_EUMVA|nr:hypothetical protein EVAR_39610_1 [Eumeta japonica]